MYYTHSTSQPDNGMNQGIPSSVTYYPHSNAVLPMIPSSVADTTSSQSQQLTSHPIMSHPPLSNTAQVYEQHQQQPQQQQSEQQHHQHHQHHQELASQDISLCTVLPSAIDEEVSSHASSSLSGNRTGGQDAYILQLQKQLEESNHLQTQYYYRIEQLMALVEKQTLRISELQAQLTNNHAGVNNLVDNSHQQHPTSTYHHPIQQLQLQQQQLQQQQQQQQQQQHHHHHNHHDPQQHQ